MVYGNFYIRRLNFGDNSKLLLYLMNVTNWKWANIIVEKTVDLEEELGYTCLVRTIIINPDY